MSVAIASEVSCRMEVRTRGAKIDGAIEWFEDMAAARCIKTGIGQLR